MPGAGVGSVSSYHAPPTYIDTQPDRDGVGAMLLGVGSAGGDLTWNLWVTKFAPPGRVADYMGLHTFFTGTRAIAAPIIGFAIIDSTPLSTVALMAAGLMVAASFVLVPEMRVERRARAEAAAVTAQ